MKSLIALTIAFLVAAVLFGIFCSSPSTIVRRDSIKMLALVKNTRNTKHPKEEGKEIQMNCIALRNHAEFVFLHNL